MSGPAILVVGCGGIGGVVAASLAEQGHDVVGLTKNGVIADAVRLHGYRLRGDGGPGAVRGPIATSPKQLENRFDYVLLAMQPTDVEEAARSLTDHLAEDGRMVCFQNGLCEERVGEIVGLERVIGAIVAWGASMIEPGVYDRTSAGGFTLGRVGLPSDDAVRALGALLEAVGPVTLTENLWGARWSKLAINCAISSLGAVGGDRLGVLMRRRFVRRLALEIMSEVVAVARAEGVTLEKVSGTLDLDWLALTDEERSAKASAGLVAKHALLLAVGARFRRLRSSMLGALERGRMPAVDFLNGEVAGRGREHRVATPMNAAIQDEVHRLAEGGRPSIERLERFYRETRAVANEPFRDDEGDGAGGPEEAGA